MSDKDIKAAVSELEAMLQDCSSSNRQFQQWRLISEQTIRTSLACLAAEARCVRLVEAHNKIINWPEPHFSTYEAAFKECKRISRAALQQENGDG